jgi:hypothetical protein
MNNLTIGDTWEWALYLLNKQIVQTQGTPRTGRWTSPISLEGPGIRHGVGVTVDIRLEIPCSR